MIEVESEKDHRENVERGDPPDTKAGDEIPIDVAAPGDVESLMPPGGVDLSGGEMEDVQDDEDEEQHSAPSHRARCPRGHLRLTLLIANRPRRARAHRELVGHEHMQNDG